MPSQAVQEIDEIDVAGFPAATGSFTAEQSRFLEDFFSALRSRAPVSRQASAAENAPAHDAASAEMFHGTPVEDLCREELWKYEQDPLDVWDKLLAHAAEDRAPAPDDLFRFKFHGLFYVAPAQDSFMLRMRIPGGVLTSAQMRGLAEMAEEWGSGRADITTRANLQIREFQPRDIVRVLNKVQSLGMSSRGTGADNIRNITASPLSGIDPEELLDVQPYAQALERYIQNSRDLYGLPRKFNVAFDGGGAISVVADTNDIGFLAVRVGEGKTAAAGIYFRVVLCGITGHRQFASDCGILIRPEDAVAVAAAMMRVFSANGDRTDRKKARLKYLMDRWGVDRFLEETERLLPFPLLRVPASECEPRTTIDRAGHLGVHAQSQAGLFYIGVSVPVGRLPVKQMRALAEIADRFGCGEVRLTVWQNAILPNIQTEHLDAAQESLREAGLSWTAGKVLSGTVACTGNKGCRYASTDTKSHAVALAKHLDEQFKILEPINLHVTGCPHSCAQHYIGDIGLLGVKVNGEEGYKVNLGGGADRDQGLARELIGAIRFADLPPLVDHLMRAFERGRNSEKETFLSFTRRHSIAELRAFTQLAGEEN
ncbi:MAG TPA: NirA family protein [Acidobacteriaceae bacterium]|nr:NirA family protein [Acidobacteriaceae bacterium]